MKIYEIKTCKVETSSVTQCYQLHDDKHKSVQSSEEITGAKQTRHDSKKKKGRVVNIYCCALITEVTPESERTWLLTWCSWHVKKWQTCCWQSARDITHAHFFKTPSKLVCTWCVWIYYLSPFVNVQGLPREKTLTWNGKFSLSLCDCDIQSATQSSDAIILQYTLSYCC